MPVGEVALALGCLLGTVFGGFWRVWRVWSFGAFGAFAGWQTAALKANRKPLLWPWPWGACSGSGLGPGVPAGDGVWRVWRVLGFGGFGRFWRAFAGWQTAALKAYRKPLLWPWPWGACWGSGLGPGVPVREGVWRVLEGGSVLEGLEGALEPIVWRVWTWFWGVWRVWRVLEGLRAGKRQL